MDGLKAILSFDAVAYDYDDEYLTIDTDTHTININNVSRLFGVQYDGNSKLIKFRIRNKLSDIQKMQDSIVYINWIDSRGVKGQSIAINKTINNDTCEFSWKVPFDALKNSGVLHFAMSAVVTKNSSSVIDQRWSTQIASVITPDGIYIKSYTPNSEEEDRIAQIYNELSNMINKQNDNLQSQVSSLKENIGELQSSVYNTHQEYVEITNGIVMLPGFSITKVSSITFTVESSSANNIKGCKVKEGEKIKITCYTFNSYIGFGYVWGSTEQTPEIWNGSNAIPMLSSDTYDYFCGNTDQEWKTYEMELTVPFGAKMIWVRTDNSYPIYKLYEIKESKIPTKTSQLENDSGFLTEKNLFEKNLFEINNIFSLPVPTFSVGTLENQMLHTLHNESVPLWKFQEVGTIDFGEVSVPHNSNDTVGLWIYCNEAMLSYRANTDGTMKVYIDGTEKNKINVAYAFRVGWNYLPIEVTENKFNLKIEFTLVRGNYEFAIDSIELNYKPKVKPKILLSFDMGSDTMYTNRHLLLKEYGFRATYCNIWNVSEINRNKMLAYGDDWAIYGNDSTSSTVYPGDNATVEEFEEYLQKTIDRAESIGLFNPVSYFSPNNAGLQNLMQALKNKGYRIGRTAVSGQYAIDYFNKDSFYINTYGVGGEETSANVLKAVDDAINAGNSICVFTHDILETPSDNINAKKSTYVEILDGIKDRVNAGKCEVCTFTDFYREWMPNDCAEYLENRHEKEKQYIIGKLSS